MAFSGTQIVAIKKYLGFPQVFDGDNYRLNGAIVNIGADPDKQTYIESILTELATVDAVVASAGQSSSARGALKAVDEVEFYSIKDSMVTVVDAPTRGRMLCGRLSTAMGVDLVGDYFGNDGYSDDSWGSAGFQKGPSVLTNLG